MPNTALFPEQQPEPDEVDEALGRVEAMLSTIERKQRGNPDDETRLGNLRARTTSILERIDKAADRERFARWAGRKKSDMSLAERSRCIAEIGSRRFLEEMAE